MSPTLSLRALRTRYEARLAIRRGTIVLVSIPIVISLCFALSATTLFLVAGLYLAAAGGFGLGSIVTGAGRLRTLARKEQESVVRLPPARVVT